MCIRDRYNKVLPIIARMDHLAEVMTIDDCGSGFCFDDLIELGKQNREKNDPVIERNKQEISPDDVATIIYTSGTTGKSKGVMLTHRKMCIRDSDQIST